MKITAGLIAALLSVTISAAPGTEKAVLLQKAHQAYVAAQALEAALNEKPEAERTRAEYLKVIAAYQRTYLITPHTGYADNALTAIAKLYEEIKDNSDAIKTLKFLIHEYPSTPFKDAAEKDIARLSGITTLSKTTSVDNIRYWEAQNSVRVVVDVGDDVTLIQGEAKDPDRVFIDVTPARLNSALIGKQWPVKSGLLQQIRVGQYDLSTVRVVLDLGTIGRVTSFTLRDPDRLIIDVLGKEGMNVASPAPGAPSPNSNNAAPASTASATPADPVTTPPPVKSANNTTANKKTSDTKPATGPTTTASAPAAAPAQPP